MDARVCFFVLLSLVAAQAQHVTRAAVNGAAAPSSNFDRALEKGQRRLAAPTQTSIAYETAYASGIATTTASGVKVGFSTSTESAAPRATAPARAAATICATAGSSLHSR